MGDFDIPASIEYSENLLVRKLTRRHDNNETILVIPVQKTTNSSKMIYVGHSLGCAVFFIAMIKHPELNDKIDLMIALAPSSSMAHFKSPLRFISRFHSYVEVRGADVPTTIRPLFH